MILEVYNIKGEKTSKTVEFADDAFLIKPNDHAIYLDVKRILAAKRQGTHSAKDRSMISGSTRKLFRQKGTGGARRGDIKSPLLKGGGRIFPPSPRDYSIKLNKKVKALARKSAFFYKLNNNKIIIVEDFQLETPKTRDYAEILKNLNINEKKNLLIINTTDPNIKLSARNIPNAFISTPNQMNTYEILNNDTIILTESSVEDIKKILN